jgi:positive regulator of sigma E activity
MIDVPCDTPLRPGIQIVVGIELDYMVRAAQ